MENDYASQAKPSQAKPSQAKPSCNSCLASISSSRSPLGARRSIQYPMLFGNYGLPRICTQMLAVTKTPRHREDAQPTRRSTAAFTLIELSIALVIIGLIVGGVLVGQDLIKAAQIRSQISEWEAFRTKTFAFKSKYNSLPGDAPNAAQLLASQSCCSPVNGNGNGRIDPVATFFAAEVSMYFQSLYLAGLSDKYTGVNFTQTNGNDNMPQFGVSIPRIKLNRRNAVWHVVSLDPTNLYNSNGPYIPKGEHYFLTGVMTYEELRPNVYEAPWDQKYAVFYPSEARQIDSKIDDGKPLTGSVLSSQGYNHPEYWMQLDRGAGKFCSAGGEYLSNDTYNGCALAIKAGF